MEAAVGTVADSKRIYPVLLSGGSGSRLWPLSRERMPKQLLNLTGEQSMLQATAARVTDPARFAAPLVICNEEHRFIIAEQLRQAGTAGAVMLEPVARNTAPAIAAAALQIAATDSDGLILVLPADHVVLDQASFRAAIDRAATAAAGGFLVTFGITPDKPETGYGYIHQGSALTGCEQVFQVAAFVEKPPLEQARRYVDGGEHFWNSGMFLFPVARLLAELEAHAPAVLAAARAALDNGSRDLDFFRLDRDAFAVAPSISIDYAVMEKTTVAAVAPCAIGWTDVGAWSALWDIADKDGDGNVCLGDVILEGTRNSYVRTEGPLTAVVGVDDVTVVVTDDAVLVADRNRAQDVKLVVERLKKAGRSEPVEHSVVHRPWGSYQTVHGGERFQVKCLTVKPGGRLSLQKHFHRAEHWVVVQGTALVTRGEETVPVYENQSIYIPTGTVHRLENHGKIPLSIIEVQSGAYLGEDDIVRLEDSYGREGKRQ